MREIVQFQYDRGLMEVSLEKLENLFRLQKLFVEIEDWKKVTINVSEISRVLKEDEKKC